MIEVQIKDLLDHTKQRRIHVSQINKQIHLSEGNLKEILHKLIRNNPEIGDFEYSTGWIVLRHTPPNLNSLRIQVIGSLVILIVGIILPFLYVNVFSFTTGLSLMVLSITFLIIIKNKSIYQGTQDSPSQASAKSALALGRFRGT